MIGFPESCRHFFIGAAHRLQLGAALFIRPGRVEHRHAAACANLFAQSPHAAKKGFSSCNRSVRILLQHDIVPVFFQGLQCRSTHLRLRIQLLGEMCAAPGMGLHMRAGDLPHHVRHIMKKGKAVAQHQNPHQRVPPVFPFLKISSMTFCASYDIIPARAH